jgi:hypothetical protein
LTHSTKQKNNERTNEQYPLQTIRIPTHINKNLSSSFFLRCFQNNKTNKQTTTLRAAAAHSFFKFTTIIAQMQTDLFAGLNSSSSSREHLGQ